MSVINKVKLWRCYCYFGREGFHLDGFFVTLIKFIAVLHSFIGSLSKKNPQSFLLSLKLLILSLDQLVLSLEELIAREYQSYLSELWFEQFQDGK